MNIELQGIHKRFGKVHANDDINLTFREGHIIGILGENACRGHTEYKGHDYKQECESAHGTYLSL